MFIIIRNNLNDGTQSVYVGPFSNHGAANRYKHNHDLEGLCVIVQLADSDKCRAYTYNTRP